MDTIVLNPKRVRVVLDATTYNAFRLCEEFLNLRHNHSLVPLGGMGPNIEKGLMMHHMLETFYKAKKVGDNRDVRVQKAMQTGQLFITGCENCIALNCREHKDNPYRGLQNVNIDEAHNVQKTFLQYEEHWKNDSWTTLETEHVKGAVIYEDEGISVLWKAKIDWLIDNDEGIFSVDHKTTSRREEISSLDNQFIGQCVVTKQIKMYRNIIGYQTSLKPSEKFGREPVIYTKQRIAEWIMEVASYSYDLAALQESGRYRHNFTACKRKYGDCIFRKVCEGNPNDRQRLIEEQFKVAEKKWDISND